MANRPDLRHPLVSMGWGRRGALGLGALVLVVCGSSAQAQVWTCADSFQTTAFLEDDFGNDFTNGTLACPTGTSPFSSSTGYSSAAGQLSSASDGNGTSVTIDVDVTELQPERPPDGQVNAIGLFQLAFDKATLVSFDYDVQGSGGSLYVGGNGCDDPNGTAVPTANGVDYYFGPGGGTCYATVSATLPFSGPGSYESVLSVTGTASPLPVTPSLAVEIIDEYGGGDQSLRMPYDVGVDSGGNVFVSSSYGSLSTAVYQVTPGGAITPLFLLGDPSVHGLAVGPGGDVFIVSQTWNTATRITPGAGSTQIIDSSGDGAGHSLDFPMDIAVDGAGNAYVAGGFSQNVFKITPGGTITQILDASGDGTHPFSAPLGVDVDAAGNVYVTGSGSNNVFEIAPGGVISQILDASGDGAGHTLGGPGGIVVSPAGDVYVGGTATNNVFHITPTGTVSQLLDASGNGSGHACEQPERVALDPEQNLYVACYQGNDVLQVAPDGTVTQLMDGTGDGAANPLRGPYGVAYHAGRLYVTGVGTNNAFRINLARQVPLRPGWALLLGLLVLASAAALLRRTAP